MVAAKNTKHGGVPRGSAWPAGYTVWLGMRDRCNNPKSAAYHRYGGRGIRVCERWDHFEHFVTDMGPKPGKEYSLDRIDNDGPYSPENCRWATKTEQAQHTGRSRALTHDGVTMTVAAWARHLGVPAYRLYARLYAGKSTAETLAP